MKRNSHCMVPLFLGVLLLGVPLILADGIKEGSGKSCGCEPQRGEYLFSTDVYGGEGGWSGWLVGVPEFPQGTARFNSGFRYGDQGGLPNIEVFEEFEQRVVETEYGPQDQYRQRIKMHAYGFPGGNLGDWKDDCDVMIRLGQGSTPRSKTGETTYYPPVMSNEPEQLQRGTDTSGCGSCNQQEKPGDFRIAMHLGAEDTSVPGMQLSELGRLEFTSNLKDAHTLSRSSLRFTDMLTQVDGDMSSAEGALVRDLISGAVRARIRVTETAVQSGSPELASLVVTITPEDGSAPETTHTFERVVDGAFEGLRYKRAEPGKPVESLELYNLGTSTSGDGNAVYGTFKERDHTGKVRQWDAQPEVAGTFQWNAQTGTFTGELVEVEQVEPADPAEGTVQTTRVYGRIGDETESRRVLRSETVVISRGTQVVSTRVTRHGYDERPWLYSTLHPEGTPNANFGVQSWETQSDGSWTLTMPLEEAVLVPVDWDQDGNPTQWVLDVRYEGSDVVFTPWLNGPATDFSTQAAAEDFFAAQKATARANGYFLSACRRTLVRDNSNHGLSDAAWVRRQEEAIGMVPHGLEYTYDSSGHSAAFSLSGGGSLPLTSRTERWNADETSSSWTANYQPLYNSSITASVDQAGMATVRAVSLESGGGARAETWRAQVTNVQTYDPADPRRIPPSHAEGAAHPLWNRQITDSKGRTVGETTLFRPQGGSDTTIQVISTDFTGETGYTRSNGESKAEDVVAEENGVRTRTSSFTDSQGIETVTKSNDETGEVISEIRKGAPATEEYAEQPDLTTYHSKSVNATNGETTLTVTQTDGTTTRTLSTTVTDAQGQIKSSTDENGRTTSYVYEDNGRRVIETITPGGLTRVTTTYLDGQLKSITGTAVVPEFHDYTVNDGTNAAYEAGSITETVWTGWDGTGSAPAGALWRKTTTNFLGQVLREEQPSPAEGGGVIATVHSYNAKGQRVKSQTTGQAAMLFTYDDWGNLQRQGYDLNEDDLFTPNSPDQVSEQTLTYEVAGDTVFEVSTQSVWGRAGGTATTRRDLRDAMGTWQERTAGNGSYLVFKTETDAASRMRWEASGVNLDENWKSYARVYYNGLLMSEPLTAKRRTYGYDGFGNMTQMVERTIEAPKIGQPVQTTTLTRTYTGPFLTSEQSSGTGTRTYTRDGRTFAYYPADHVNTGQVKSITEGGHVTRYGYDALGRQTHQWGDAVQPLRYEYDALGRLWKMHTYQGGTGWDSETLPEAFTSAAASTTTWTYRPGTNALWRKTDALSRSVTYAYDASGLLLSKTNARGTTATYSYAQTPSGKKIPGRTSGVSYDDGSTPPVAFSYHPDGSLRTATDAAGTQGINLAGSSVLTRHVVVYGDGLLNGVLLNRAHVDEDHPTAIQLELAGAPLQTDANGSLSYGNVAPVFARAYNWWFGGTYTRLLGLSNTSSGGLTVQPSTSVSYTYLNGLVKDRYVQGMNYQTSYRYMPDGAVMEIATQTRRYNYGGRMVGRGGYADEWYYEFDSRGRRKNMLWTDKYEPDFQDRHPKRWIYEYNERGEVEQAEREGQFLTENGWEMAPVTHQRRNYTFDLMGNRNSATQGTSAAEKAAFTQDYTPNALQQYGTVAHGRVVEITGEAAEGAVVALRIDEGTPFNVDRTLPENQTGDYNSFRYLHTVTGSEARWVKVEFTVTLGAAVTLRQGFVYVPPAHEAPQHDLDGNLTDDGRWVYTWDAENRLTSMTQKVIAVAASVSTPPARTRLEFAYDYKNRRIAKRVFVAESGTGLQPVVWRLTKDLRFVYDGYQMIAELDATFATGTGVAGITPTRGVVRTYLWGPDVSGTMTGAGGVGGLLAFTFQGDSYYPISDANGNIAAIHAPGINQVIRFDYDPFGNRITNTGPDVELCPMGFSSKYTDSETGLVYYGYRYYSTELGRWLSRDPIGERGGINLYGMVENDPVNKWDYLGLATVEVRLTRGLTGYFAVYGRLKATLKLEESEKKKFECCAKFFPKSFLTMESTDTSTITPRGTYTPYFKPENSGGGRGSTSIQWKLQRGVDASPMWWSSEEAHAAKPVKPSYMSDADYMELLNMEFHIGWSGNGGGNNVHFGPNSNHSDGCVLIGTQEITMRSRFNFRRHHELVEKNGEDAIYEAPGFALQDTVNAQFALLEAIQCARKKGAQVKFIVTNRPKARDPEATAIPERPPENGIPKALPYDNF